MLEKLRGTAAQQLEETKYKQTIYWLTLIGIDYTRVYLFISNRFSLVTTNVENILGKQKFYDNKYFTYLFYLKTEINPEKKTKYLL